MAKDIKEELKAAMEQRGIKTPELAELLDIPKDRIYAWYRDKSNPKGEDREKIQKWINGEIFIKSHGRGQTYGSFEERLIVIEAQLEIFTNVLASILAGNDPLILQDKKEDILKAVRSAINRRLDELNKL